jgi:hypothetical protein
MMEIKRFLKPVFFVIAAIFVVSAFQKDRFPDKEDILPELFREPSQTAAQAGPFSVEIKNVRYDITPLYDYELYGMIVSYHHSKVWWDTDHKESRDFVNTSDICVFWGDNLKSEVYKKMKFSSGCWTCYWDFKSSARQNDWANFRQDCGSNNHILTDDPALNRRILSAERGDQIYIRGYLVKYTQKDWGGFQRASSTIRTDNGCEVIFVKDFRILKKANPGWRYLHRLAKYALAICFIFLAVDYFKTPAYSADIQ